MNYETWRATFQSSEQAARAAYQLMQTAVEQEGGYPDCDTCGKSVNYMPWHYAKGERRHLHACDECWPRVNPSTSLPDGLSVTLHNLAQGLDNLKRNANDAYDRNYIAAMLKDVDGLLTTSAVKGDAHHEG